MEKDEQNYKIMALMDHEQPRSFYGNDHNYGHITIRPVKWLTPSGQVRNFTTSPLYPEFEPALYLADLQLTCQYHVETGGVSEPYGYRLEYKAHKVEMEDAEKMTKTFKKIDKKTEAYRQEWGNPQSFGEYAMRFLKAIGAGGVLRKTSKGRGSGYDNNEFQPWALTDLPWLVKNAVAEVQEKVDAKLAA